MLKQKVGNCCIPRTQHINQNKTSHQNVNTSRSTYWLDMTQRTEMTLGQQKLYIVIFLFVLANLIKLAETFH